MGSVQSLSGMSANLLVVGLCNRTFYMPYNENKTPNKGIKMFDPNANPETVAARAAELSIEQLDRLKDYLAVNGSHSGASFYADPFEASISNKIAQLMGAYGVLKGYVKDPSI